MIVEKVYVSGEEAAEELIKDILSEAKAAEKNFNIAFSGGNSPSTMFKLWVEKYKDSTPWEKFQFYWVDERCVSPEDEQSNYGVMKKLLLDKVPVLESQIHRIKGEEEPEKEALRYEKEYMSQVGAFDYVILGAGDDGHTSSIFPGQEELLTGDRVYEKSVNPYTKQMRVALTAKGILAAKKVVFLIVGASKRLTISRIKDNDQTAPAAYIANKRDVVLFIDNAAWE